MSPNTAYLGGVNPNKGYETFQTENENHHEGHTEDFNRDKKFYDFIPKERFGGDDSYYHEDYSFGSVSKLRTDGSFWRDDEGKWSSFAEIIGYDQVWDKNFAVERFTNFIKSLSSRSDDKDTHILKFQRDTQWGYGDVINWIELSNGWHDSHHEEVIDYHKVYVDWYENSYSYVDIQNPAKKVDWSLRKNSTTEEITFNLNNPLESPTFTVQKTHELWKKLSNFFNSHTVLYPEANKLITKNNFFLSWQINRTSTWEDQWHHNHNDQIQVITEQSPVLLNFEENPFSKHPVKIFYKDFLYFNQEPPFDTRFFDDDGDKEKSPSSSDKVFLRGVHLGTDHEHSDEWNYEWEEFFLVKDENDYYKTFKENELTHDGVNSYEFEGNIFKGDDGKLYLEIMTKPKPFSVFLVNSLFPIICILSFLILLLVLLKRLLVVIFVVTSHALRKIKAKVLKRRIKKSAKKLKFKKK